MANKRQRKKAAKKAASYEGQQYRGGRQSGRKNLVKTDTGKLINQHGVQFTHDDKRKLENAVNAANRKRAKMLKQESTLPRMVAGKPSGQTLSDLQRMGKESDFILAKKTKSLQRFTSRAQFEKYLDNLSRVNSPDYLTERIRQYKRNHMQALNDAFGDDAKDVVMKIRMMNPDDYMKMVQQDEMLEINYIYDPSARSGKLNQIRASLGMKLKEDDFEDLE